MGANDMHHIVTVDELIKDIRSENPRDDGAIIIASSPTQEWDILSIYADENGNLCIDIAERS